MTVRYYWAVIVGFLAGVFIRSLVSLDWYAIYFALVLAGALLVLSRVARAQSVVAGIFLLALAVGAVRMEAAHLVGDTTLNAHLGNEVTIEGFVFEEPDRRESSTRLHVRADTVRIADATTTVSAGILIIAPLHTDAAYGDRIRAEGELRLPESFEAGAGRAFNYPAFLAKDGIGYQLSFAEVEVIGDGQKNFLKAAAIFIKQKYLEGLGLSLPEPQAGLAGGITAGDKRGLGSELSETFRSVGLIHIVVLSGYNIMVVIGFIDWALSRARRSIRFSLGFAVPIFFALMTGLASSSVRAALMAMIATLGKITSRTYLASRALGLVAFLMVLWNPWVLTFDPGFQLSVIATWGLIFVSPFVAARLGFLTEKLGLREIAATTIGTQLAVLPLLLYQSGQLSLVALPANLLALIIVPWAMLASFIAGVFGLVAGPLAPIAGFPAYVLLSYILFVAEWAAKIPFASVTVVAIPATLVFLCYIALALVAVRFSSR